MLRASVCRPGELGPGEIERWRAIQRQNPSLASPFLAPEFAQAVDAVRSDARVAVLDDGARNVGFFVFQKRRSVGSGIGRGVSDYQAVIAPREVVLDGPMLLRRAGLSVWEFDHLIAAQAAAFTRHAVLRPSWVMDLSGGYGSYLAEREASSPGTMRSMRRKRTKLYREHAVRFVADDDRSLTLRTLRSWKSAQYRRTGRRDRFSRPWIVELTERLLESRSEDCRGILASLWAGDQLIAAHLGLLSPAVLACWFPAFNREFGRYSPGFELFLRMAEDAASRGVGHLDLGKGDEAFKQVLANGHHLVAEGSADTGTVAARLRRARTAPRGLVEAQVRTRPRARRLARRALAGWGRLRRPA